MPNSSQIVINTSPLIALVAGLGDLMNKISIKYQCKKQNLQFPLDINTSE